MAAVADILSSANPAAGSDLTHTFAADALIHSMALTFVTDANAANRVVRLTLTDSSGNVYWRCSFSNTQAASTTAFYVLYEGAGFNSNSFVIAPLPTNGLQVNAGDILTITATNKQAGDDFTAAIFQYTQI